MVASLQGSTTEADESNEESDSFTVMVLGDSLSAAYRLSGEEAGWVSLLQKRFTNLGLHANVLNASVSGETTSGGLTRLPLALQQHQPDYVILELGGNDGLRGYPIAIIESNLREMVDKIKKAGAFPILVGMQMPPSYGPVYTRKFEQLYKNIANDEKCGFVPFMLEGIALDRSLMQRDGVHPTGEAQAKLLNNIWSELEKHIEPLKVFADVEA